MDTFTLHQGTTPLLISLPHDGSFIPDDVAARMHPSARRSPDTDWHVGRLYGPLAEALGASLIKPVASRYVIDLNRPADGHALYPGQKETGLVSTIGFDGEALYRNGEAPDAAEIQRRINDYWRPYHHALAYEIERLLKAHGRMVLWEGHSIRSKVPMLFDGQLPDFNLGTATGTSCSEVIQAKLQGALEAQQRYTFAINGRFKGGYITRHYGSPAAGVHAIQLELSQVNYMDEESFLYDEEKAVYVQHVIRHLLQTALA